MLLQILFYVFGHKCVYERSENKETKDVAKFWKNGIAIALPDGTKEACLSSVFVTVN